MDKQIRLKLWAGIFILSFLIAFFISDIYKGLPFIQWAFTWYIQLWEESRFLATGVFLGIAWLLTASCKAVFGPPFTSLTKLLEPLARKRATREIESYAPLPFTIKELSLLIPTIDTENTPHIRKDVGEYKWYSFHYADTPRLLHVEFLSESETAPIRRIHVELEWLPPWFRSLLPVCVEEIMAILIAITEMEADAVEQMRISLNKLRRKDYKTTTKVIILKIFSPDKIAENKKVFGIWNSQKQLRSD